jgi:hypothetical protein
MDLLDWPPKSPDLSPIEHIWAHLKIKLEGHEFSSHRELFGFLVQESDNLRAEFIDGYCTNFSARLQIYQQINGECLNGHWKDIHYLHHQPSKIDHGHVKKTIGMRKMARIEERMRKKIGWRMRKKIRERRRNPIK